MSIQRSVHWIVLHGLTLFVSNVALSEVQFLQQNWNEATRQAFYTTSQGSRLLPYDWFVAMEVSDGEASFVQQRVPELGYLPNNNSQNNPDRLPVGFVADTDAAGTKHVGLNCSACHTNQISYNGKTYQIDGGPTLADMWGLMVGIGDSLNATLREAPKFSRFANNVLGQNHADDDAEELKTELTEFTRYWNKLVSDSRTEHPWGRARLDAFGMIFNRVTAIDLDMPENNRKPDAPVSFPFLWGTSWEDKVQWNGSAPNSNDIERLGRNVGEVLGVFAQADLQKASLFKPFYRTSARRLNQVRLENHLKELWSPAWPTHLGSIDGAKRDAGRVLFADNCVSCHQVIPHRQQKTPVKVVMTPLSRVGTDPKMAMNAATGTVLTGRLQGSRIPGFPPLPAQMPRGALLSNVVRGALFSLFRDVSVTNDSMRRIDFLRTRLRGLRDQTFSDEEILAFLRELDLTEEEVLAFAVKYEEKLAGYYEDLKEAIQSSTSTAANATDDDGPSILAYKARPLDGIWATAPYLHNGSVPNLYELLLPAAKRSKAFYVGSNHFDPIHVGFKTEQAAGTTHFDTSKPGNSNAGHDTYGTFNEEERWQLVEYMKTL